MNSEIVPDPRAAGLRAIRDRNVACTVSAAVVGLAFLLGWYASDKPYHLAAGLVIVLVAVFDYVYLAVRLDNWLDMTAVFAGSWTFTVGLASLRLCQYQTRWAGETWLCLGVACAAFTLGDLLQYNVGRKLWLHTALERVSAKYPVRGERLFWIALTASLVSLACLTINACIRGYLPFFSESKTAYLDFYTKFHILTVGGTAASGLCYYNIKRGGLSRFKKAVMWACLVYLSLVMPILVVSRGTFLINAVYVTTVVFYLNKKKFLALILCMVIMFGGYEVGTRARNYTDEDNSALFASQRYTVTFGDDRAYDVSFSPNLLFMYSYLTIGHDNFDQAVKNAEDLTWGLRQLTVLTAIPIPFFRNLLAGTERYLVNDSLNTTNLVTPAYYDLRLPGVVLLSALLGYLFAALERIAGRKDSPFRLMFLGYAMVAVMLGFFMAWVSSFALIMPAGCAFLMLAAAAAGPVGKKAVPSNRP